MMEESIKEEIQDEEFFHYLHGFVNCAKRINDKKGEENSSKAIIDTMVAILISVCSGNRESKDHPNSGLSRMERDSARKLKKINEINVELRKVIEEHEKLLLTMKNTKREVVSEYRTTMLDFREIVKEVGNEACSNEFQDILENVIKEAAVYTSSQNSSSTDNLSELEQLFEDQNLMEEFAELGEGESGQPGRFLFCTGAADALE